MPRPMSEVLADITALQKLKRDLETLCNSLYTDKGCAFEAVSEGLADLFDNKSEEDFETLAEMFGDSMYRAIYPRMMDAPAESEQTVWVETVSLKTSLDAPMFQLSLENLEVEKTFPMTEKGAADGLVWAKAMIACMEEGFRYTGAPAAQP